MKKFNRSLLFLLTVLFVSSVLTAQSQSTVDNPAIQNSDIKQLTGDWKGTLTYIDYKSNQPYSMPCELTIKAKKNQRKLLLCYTYPNEPKANSKAKINISKEGTIFNGHPLNSRTTTAEGDLQITTEHSGKDGNDGKAATIKNVYLIGTEKLIIRKEVQFTGESEWILRNEYRFARK